MKTTLSQLDVAEIRTIQRFEPPFEYCGAVYIVVPHPSGAANLAARIGPILCNVTKGTDAGEDSADALRRILREWGAS